MRRYKPTAQKKYGMTKLGIFGSVARGEQTENSDVDVCYEGKAPSLLTLDMIQTELEQLLNCKVDLVRVRDNMNSLLRQRIIRRHKTRWMPLKRGLVRHRRKKVRKACCESSRMATWNKSPTCLLLTLAIIR